MLSSTDLHTLRPELVRVCELAGAYVQAQRARLASVAIEHKAPGDVASQIDQETEALLREHLQSLLPGAGFLGEESGGSLQGEAVWVVDPIDGSANYLRGYPHYAVSVALAVQGEPLLGVVHDPCRSESFSAARGEGAWLGNTQLSPLAHTARNALQATCATVFPKPQSLFMDEYLAVFARAIRCFAQLRRSGSMALDLAYLAAGRVDAFWERGMGAWDAAAGIVLLREVGAEIWAVDAQPLLQSQYLAACAPGLRDALTACLDTN
jgi:myo-inositol-1(or 4)-monophosphatase